MVYNAANLINSITSIKVFLKTFHNDNNISPIFSTIEILVYRTLNTHSL